MHCDFELRRDKIGCKWFDRPVIQFAPECCSNFVPKITLSVVVEIPRYNYLCPCLCVTKCFMLFVGGYGMGDTGRYTVMGVHGNIWSIHL